MFTIFMLLKTTPTWLAKSPPERFAFVDEVIRPLLRDNPEVKLRFFESEGFNARTSDIAMWQTDSLSAWQAVVEKLRETAFWDRYFQVTEILPAVENAFAAHYGVAPLAG